MIKVKINNRTEYKKLSVFDFDGTLFKSPEKPKGYKGNWWINKDSMNEPSVPKKPDDSFWNLDVVDDAKRELNSNNTLCIMMTGRIGQFFEDRVLDLLSQKSLHFPMAKFNELSNDTGEFKIKEIKALLKKHPSIQKIEMWEDDEEKIELYKETFGSLYHLEINKI